MEPTIPRRLIADAYIGWVIVCGWGHIPVPAVARAIANADLAENDRRRDYLHWSRGVTR
jgi:hypothetical protein